MRPELNKPRPNACPLQVTIVSIKSMQFLHFDHYGEYFFPDRGHSWNVLPIPRPDGRHSCKLLSIPGPDQMMIVQMKPVLVACFKDDD